MMKPFTDQGYTPLSAHARNLQSLEVLGIVLGLLVLTIGIPALVATIQDYRQKKREERLKGLVSRG